MSEQIPIYMDELNKVQNRLDLRIELISDRLEDRISDVRRDLNKATDTISTAKTTVQSIGIMIVALLSIFGIVFLLEKL